MSAARTGRGGTVAEWDRMQRRAVAPVRRSLLQTLRAWIAQFAKAAV